MRINFFNSKTLTLKNKIFIFALEFDFERFRCNKRINNGYIYFCIVKNN